MYKADPLNPFAPEEEAALKASLDELSALPMDDSLDPFTPEEHAALEAALDAIAGKPLDIVAFEALPSEASAQPAPPPLATTGSVVAPGRSIKITIRLPANVMHAVRREARRTGLRYQTLINDTLRRAAAKW